MPGRSGLAHPSRSQALTHLSHPPPFPPIVFLDAPLRLCNPQYIVKPARSSLASFRWHRDSDWCRSGQFTYAPYISVRPLCPSLLRRAIPQCGPSRRAA